MNHQKCAEELADHWLDLMSPVGWVDAAASIQRRHPAPCGETTTLEKDSVLFDVSDSWEWVDRAGGAIRLTVEVYLNPDEPPLASRTRIVQPD